MVRPLPLPPEVFTLRMDAGAWTEPLLDIEEERFAEQTALKSTRLAGNSARHVCCPPEAEPLVWEALTLLLTAAADDWPQWFALERSGPRRLWTNRFAGTTTGFLPGSTETLSETPLGWLGRQFQEDIVLLDADGVCVAGHVCFPSGWSLREKIGQTFGEIHAPVPGFADRAGGSAERLVQQLKSGRPVGRWNWTFPATDQLTLDSTDPGWKESRTGVTPENAGERCFLRTERQTLSRLPKSRGMLFTIHTYLTPISRLAADPDTRRRLYTHLHSLPEATVAYRGMTAYYAALLSYLR